MAKPSGYSSAAAGKVGRASTGELLRAAAALQPQSEDLATPKEGTGARTKLEAQDLAKGHLGPVVKELKKRGVNPKDFLTPDEARRGIDLAGILEARRADGTINTLTNMTLYKARNNRGVILEANVNGKTEYYISTNREIFRNRMEDGQWVKKRFIETDVSLRRATAQEIKGKHKIADIARNSQGQELKGKIVQPQLVPGLFQDATPIARANRRANEEIYGPATPGEPGPGSGPGSHYKWAQAAVKKNLNSFVNHTVAEISRQDKRKWSKQMKFQEAIKQLPPKRLEKVFADTFNLAYMTPNDMRTVRAQFSKHLTRQRIPKRDTFYDQFSKWTKAPNFKKMFQKLEGLEFQRSEMKAWQKDALKGGFMKFATATRRTVKNDKISTKIRAKALRGIEDVMKRNRGQTMPQRDKNILEMHKTMLTTAALYQKLPRASKIRKSNKNQFIKLATATTRTPNHDRIANKMLMKARRTMRAYEGLPSTKRNRQIYDAAEGMALQAEIYFQLPAGPR